MLLSHNAWSFPYRFFKASHWKVREACPKNGLPEEKLRDLSVFIWITAILRHTGKIQIP